MYAPFDARTWAKVALMVLYVPSCPDPSACSGRGQKGITHRVDVNDSLETLLREPLNGDKEVASSTCTQRRLLRGCKPRSEALTTNDEVDPAELLDGLRYSILELLRLAHIGLRSKALSPSGLGQLCSARVQSVKSAQREVSTVAPTPYSRLLTFSPQWSRPLHDASTVVTAIVYTGNTCTRTTASVIPLQIPEPPPVQNNTLPLKISSLKMAEESTTGATYAGEVMAVSLVYVNDKQLLYTTTPSAVDCRRQLIDAGSRA